MNRSKRELMKKYVFNGLFVVLVLMMLFIPSAKAVVIRGLIEIGLFNPKVEIKKKTVNDNLTNIKFKKADGKIVSLVDLKGKIVFINFWATWCPPCLAEMPSINKFYQQFKNDAQVVFLMVDADSDFSKAQAYMNRKDYGLPIYAPASSMPTSIFNGVLPTTTVLDKKGRISFHGEGAANYASRKFIDFIKQLKTIE